MASMITTTDNPYDPFDEFDQWFQYDMVKGYNTPGLLARLAITSNSLSDADQDTAIDNAIDAILDINPNGLYIRVERADV